MGKKLTGFSNEEEEIVGWTKVSCYQSHFGIDSSPVWDQKDLPFLLEDKIKSLGGIYENTEPWAVSIVALYNGQF